MYHNTSYYESYIQSIRYNHSFFRLGNCWKNNFVVAGVPPSKNALSFYLKRRGVSLRTTKRFSEAFRRHKFHPEKCGLGSGFTPYIILTL